MSLGELSKAARGRIDALTKGHPELAPWLRLLVEALVSTRDRLWSAPLSDISVPSQTGAPLLANQVIPVDVGAAEGIWQRLLALAQGGGSLDRAPPPVRNLDALALLEAAINQDEERPRALAESLGASVTALAPVATLASMPLLHACRERLGPDIKSSLGFCPICAAWPALSELRGLERSRVLRCGRCGAGWKAEPLQCVYCGEHDHEKLGALVPEERAESRKVDVCKACGGYLKAVATLGALSPDAVALEDLATVDLDLAALDRGYSRPDRSPASLATTLVAARARAPLAP